MPDLNGVQLHDDLAVGNLTTFDSCRVTRDAVPFEAADVTIFVCSVKTNLC